jgi:hypothetical protein
MAVIVIAVAIFYLEEDWRGKHAWNACKRTLAAKSVTVDWSQYIPRPVPDDQNFFTASTNILIRFHRPQIPAETAAAAQLKWLPTSWPDYPSSFDSAKAPPLVVAELTFLPPARAAGAMGDQAANFDDPAARIVVLQAIEKNVGRSLPGAITTRFSELQLSNLAPVRIALRAKTQPAISDLENFLSSDLITNLGRVHIEAGRGGTLQVFLTNVQATAAADYLKWSDRFVPAFDEIREALKRPCAILPGDYSNPHTIPIPNFVALRAAAQTLSQRAKCHLLLQDPDAAFREITLIHDLCRILQKPTTGKPETLVEAMINVAITGLHVDTMANGLRIHAWQKPQLVAFQKQLTEINLPFWVGQAFHLELTETVYNYETTPADKFADLFAIVGPPQENATNTWGRLRDPIYRYLKLAPRGWMYQTLASIVTIESKPMESFDAEHGTISPRAYDKAERAIGRFYAHRSPFKILGEISTPNYTKAVQVTAVNQTLVNEAQIVCALERYRLTDSEYPASLDVLVPQFIEQLPPDVIGGQPLHYRRTDDGKFVLYSIGWNEKDDGGKAAYKHDGSEDRLNGDWVWEN